VLFLGVKWSSSITLEVFKHLTQAVDMVPRLYLEFHLFQPHQLLVSSH